MLSINDIVKIFEEIELRLVRSLKLNLSRHKVEEQEYGFDWSAWQAEKLRSLQEFRRTNAAIMSQYTSQIDNETRQIMQAEFAEGMNGIDALPDSPQFFGVDNTKVNKLIDDITYLEKNAETAALRMTDDVYRQTVNRVQLAMGTGSMTLQQAIDIAVKDFLNQGINCIVYKDGRRVNIADYVRMALRTTATRATLQGKSAKFKALGYDTVQVSQYSMCSETCEPYQGRIYIEDTFSMWDGEVQEHGDMLWGKSNYCGKWFPLLSEAIRKGLFHPNCRHTILMWRDGDPLPESINNEDSERWYKLEQQQRKLENAVRKTKRKVEGLSDPENVKKAKAELRDAQKQLKDFIDKVNADEGETILKRDYGREKVYSDIPKNLIDKYPNSDIIKLEEEKPEISKEIIVDVNKAVDRVAEDFPVIKEQVEPIVFADTGSALGINRFINNSAINVIELSEHYCSDYSILRQKLNDDFKTSFSYETDNAGSLTCHELGHALHKILAMKRAGIIYGEELTPLKRFLLEKEFQKIKEEVYLASFSDETLEEIDKACISELGTMTYRNSDELIAQSFGNYYYGKNKSKVGQSIVEYFKERLN